MTHIARNGRTMRRWGVGVASAALVAASGLAGANLASSSASAGATGTPGTLTAQAAELNAGPGSAVAAKTPHRRHGLARLRGLPGMYGQFSVRSREHGTSTIAFERGVVAATGGDVTVRAADGTEWTWQLTGHTVLREGHAKVSARDLSDGDHVLIGGPVSGGTRQARVILIGRGTHGMHGKHSTDGTHSTQHAMPSPSLSGPE